MTLSAVSGAMPKPADPAPQTAERRSLARRIILDAVFLGCLADSLLHDGLGVGLFIFMVVVAAVVIGLARRRGTDLEREQLGWMAASLFFAGCFAWRDASDLLFYDFCAMAGAGLILGATLARRSPMPTILGQRVRDLARGAAFTAASMSKGLFPTVRESELGALDLWQRGRAAGVVRAVLLTLPVVLVFGLLFEVADPLFGALLSLPKIDFGLVVTHVLLAATITWLAAGWLQAAFGNVEPNVVRQAKPTITFGTTDVTALLGGVGALFALFIGVQIGWLFGGEQLVRSTTGLSYAEYARHGFFELVMVSLLLLPVLLGTRALIRDDDHRAIRRHQLLALPILVLEGGVIASALGRMALYMNYYGPSTDRLYASVFIVWLAVVFAWFGLTILRGHTRDFAAGMAITGFMTLGGLNAVDPEALVAHLSVERAPTTLLARSSTAPASPIDYSYLGWRLQGDAVDEVIRALIAPPVSPVDSPSRQPEVRARCDAVKSLLLRWEPASTGKGWRGWNLGAWRARTAVREHEAALRNVSCWDEGGERPFGTREKRKPQKGEQDHHE